LAGESGPHAVNPTIRYTAFSLVVVLSAFHQPARADDAAGEIKAALTQWTEDFNAERADKVCGLFAKDLRADVRGLQERGYEAQCELLKSSLADLTRKYSYALDIKEILVFGEVAIVRLVWTLTVKQDGSGTTSLETGMDVFRRQSDGTWKIIRYIAYEQ
jgi:ketosteroid isomerase-like protein